MKDTFTKYTKAFLENDIEALKGLFSEDAVYSECIGLEYDGLDQITEWFRDWHAAGTMNEWTIKQMMVSGNVLIAEWQILYVYEGEADGYDAVSLVTFNKEGKMTEVKEFGSKIEHEKPYMK